MQTASQISILSHNGFSDITLNRAPQKIVYCGQQFCKIIEKISLVDQMLKLAGI